MGFRVLLAGGTGQVGSALVDALTETGSCSEVVMVNRRQAALHTGAYPDSKVRQVVMDTGAADFAQAVANLARRVMAEGDPLYAASCIGIGQGSAQWSDEDIRRLEVGVVGAFARGCRTAGVERFGLLSAAGSSARSMIRYARIMGEKEDALRGMGFRHLAMVRPGIIAGNVHTPGWVAALGRLLPGPFGTIEQGDIARAFVDELRHGAEVITILGNREIRDRSRAWSAA